MMLVWKKLCDCTGKSTSHCFTIESLPETKKYYRVRITFNPGPVCDICGKAWARIVEEEDG